MQLSIQSMCNENVSMVVMPSLDSKYIIYVTAKDRSSATPKINQLMCGVAGSDWLMLSIAKNWRH